MKKNLLFFALAVGLLASAPTMQAQTVNMSRYITLTVKRGEKILFGFTAAVAGTPVRIVNGSNTYDTTANNSWLQRDYYTAGSTTMTIYGDITVFDCGFNFGKITAIDVSHNTGLTYLDCATNKLTVLDVSNNNQLERLACFNNRLTTLDVSNNTQLTKLDCYDNKLNNLNISHNTELKSLSCRNNLLSSLDVSKNTQLKELSCYSNSLSSLDVSKNTQLRRLECYDNAFTTQALNDIYCDLPDRTGYEYGVITPVKNSSSSNNATVIATNRANATAKNWRVLYRNDNTYADVPTTGTYVCPLNMSRYITLTVERDSTIHLFLSAATNNTPVRIVRGNTTQSITVGTSSTYTTITAAGTTIKVYGDITDFSCNGNYGNLTAIDVSHNTELTSLSCQDNRLSSLDVSNNTKLTKLICFRNRLSSLIVVNNVLLKELNCYGNNLNTLDVSQNMWFEELYCSNNQLSILSVWNNGYLTKLDCSNNRLSSLDLSNNTDLKILYCYGNAFTTDALDDIYCALPDRRGKEEGDIEPVYDSSSSNHATVLATNKQNATAKNWKVQYWQDNTDILTNGIYVCGTPHIEPNMSRYITLTVAKDSAIKLDFMAAQANTPIRIVSGSNTQNIIVGTSWTGTTYYTADGTEITVYGDIIGFECQQNGENLTALDLSQNTQLKRLDCSSNNLTSLDVSNNTQLTTLNCSSNNLTALDVSNNTELTRLNCYGNNFSTAALDDIYCALPDRDPSDYAGIYPVYDSSSSYNDTVLATNAQNAIDKNWQVQYYEDDGSGDTDIHTTGTYVCGTPHPELNMSRYITLTVAEDSTIKLDFKAAADGTPIRIVSGSNTRDIIPDDTDWVGGAFTADGTEMTVYGDITGFICDGNGTNLTAIDVSHNTQLTTLHCNDNQLSSLNVSNNTLLEELGCSKNPLGSLDVSNNTQLERLECSKNPLSSLDVSNNTQLKWLYCYGNKFSTAALDDIYCALPVRSASDNAKIVPVESVSAPNHATVLATNAQNAIDKNWQVQYYYDDSGDDTDIHTTGAYVCGTPHTDIAEADAEPALTLYPNPVADVLYLSATARTVRIYNIYGIEVAHATDTDKVEVSHLPAGVYTVKADGTVAKMVKR